MMYSSPHHHTMHHVPKCMSYHEAISRLEIKLRKKYSLWYNKI